MSFLTIEEATGTLYQEAIDGIGNGDTQVITDAINEAVAEAEGYIGRYDVAMLFGKTGADRDPLLVKLIKDIAKFNFLNKGIVQIGYETAHDMYTNAIKTLIRIQAGQFTPPGWPPATVADTSTYFHAISNPKRGNHF